MSLIVDICLINYTPHNCMLDNISIKLFATVKLIDNHLSNIVCSYDICPIKK